ncbi:MAG TPA: NADH-quinone oxidoreductase subunit N, partial [Planctomycetota bacterium]|nr:NADH-quinone oxidoreductase subunit N [Planctomycetota bacterium]
SVQEILESLGWLCPELTIVAALLLVVLAEVTPLRRVAGPLAVLGLLVTGGSLLELAARPSHPEQALFLGSYRVDPFATYFKIAFIGAALVTALFSFPSTRAWRSGRGEFFALLLSCTFGLMLMAGANDLLLMYLALEFVSITSYILAGLLRHNRRSAEASLKYIIYGAGASGFMIYGMSFLYGLTGTLEIGELGRRLAELGPGVPPTLTLVTSVLIMAGFGYKIAAVPFHMWCPDVYEGAPTPVTAFFSVGPKAAGFAMLARFLTSVFPTEQGGAAFEWRLVVALLAVATMAVGNFGAVHQQNLKRLLAYSSIAHAGYLLVAFVALGNALQAMLFYVIVYMIMNLGAFLVVIVLEERFGIETVEGCRGLGWRAPALGAVMTLFLFSLTGLPPTAGFVAKLLVFLKVIDTGVTPTAGALPGPFQWLPVTLVIVALVFSVISLFYYMRIAAAMFLGKPREDETRSPGVGLLYGTVLAVLAAGTVVFGVWWGPLQAFTEKAVLSR